MSSVAVCCVVLYVLQRGMVWSGASCCVVLQCLYCAVGTCEEAPVVVLGGVVCCVAVCYVVLCCVILRCVELYCVSVVVRYGVVQSIVLCCTAVWAV